MFLKNLAALNSTVFLNFKDCVIYSKRLSVLFTRQFRFPDGVCPIFNIISAETRDVDRGAS